MFFLSACFSSMTHPAIASANFSRSIVWMTSNNASACFTLLVCSGPIRWSRNADGPSRNGRPFTRRLLNAVFTEIGDAGFDRLLYNRAGGLPLWLAASRVITVRRANGLLSTRFFSFFSVGFPPYCY